MNSFSEKKQVYTVSQFNKSVRNLLEASYPITWIEGEISNLVKPASGHRYFSLKDDGAQIRCALFKNRLKSINTTLENGKKIVVMARVSLYEGRGDFQLIVESVEDAGEGLLQKKFDALKNKLLAEGLFDESQKKEFPAYPKKIGVITSPTGAVIHDILTALYRRFPVIPILVFPTLVQGDGAAEKIADMINIASKRKDCDVLILARGGGSLEDLWSFNEEVVARAIQNCEIPIISGVGHETDSTIADWVADKRAPTPTAAAEIISPDQAEFKMYLNTLQDKITKEMFFLMNNHSQRIDSLTKQLKTPDQLIENIYLKITGLGKRLVATIKTRIDNHNHSINLLSSQLNSQLPSDKIDLQQEVLKSLSTRLSSSCNKKLISLKNRLHSYTRELNAISPLETMARGYSINRNPETGRINKDAIGMKKNDLVETIFIKSVVTSRVEKIEKK